MWSIACIVAVSCVLATKGQSAPYTLTPDPEDCSKFTISLNTISWQVSCDAGKVFSRKIKNCVAANGPYDDCTKKQTGPAVTIRAYEDVFSYCANCPRCLYPDASNCAGFYNCSKSEEISYGNLRPYQDECEYPALFDADNNKCEPDYKKVEGKCGSRKILLNPCDQKSNQCGRAHCQPCQYRMPNCVGKRNGFQEWEGRSFTPYYARCLDGRTLETGTCARSRSGSPRIFSPSQKECIDVDAKTFFKN